MSIFYLVRHGNVEYNKRIPGRQKGICLSKDGYVQANALIGMFDKIHVDAIFSSPMERAVETIRPFAEKNNLDIKIRDELNEIDFGKWTGMTFEELECVKEWKLFHSYRSGCIIPGGELMIQVQTRIVKLINEIYNPSINQNIILVSHNDVIKSAIAYFCGISLDQFLRVCISTGSVSVLLLNNDESKVLCINSMPRFEIAPD